MKIKDIKEYGYYRYTDSKIIEALPDNDNGKEVLSIMVWELMDEKDGIKFYATDMFALNPENNSICNIDVVKLNNKFKIVDDNDSYYTQYGASSVMYEYKLSNTEKLSMIQELCEKESKQLVWTKDDATFGTDSVLQPTDRALLAQEIITILKGDINEVTQGKQ